MISVFQNVNIDYFDICFSGVDLVYIIFKVLAFFYNLSIFHVFINDVYFFYQINGFQNLN